ncbi:MMPL family transporter [Salinicola halophyticus]|uniref:MMPL family transporter n=1 Tax=Salinicola halophyticus TaxID=1808881 RepID=UPI003F46FD6E
MKSDRFVKTLGYRRLGWLWLVVLAFCAVWLGWMLRQGLPADTDLTALLPADRQAPLVEKADRELGRGFENRFLLLLDDDDRVATTQALGRSLQQLVDDGQLAGIDWRELDLADADPHEWMGPWRYRLLTPQWQQTIDANGGSTLVDPALRQLFSPTARPDPVADPFGLLDAWLSRLPQSPIGAADGLLTLDRSHQPGSQKWSVLIGELKGSPYDLPMQTALHTTLEQFQQQHPDAELLRSGLVFHAAAGARQAKHEMSTIGAASLLGVLLIIGFVFRSPRVLLQLMVPLLAGSLFALTLTLGIFGRLHLLTLAFGASLIGIAIDYVLHLQCDRAIEGRGFRLRRLLPSLTLGLISSVIAYVAQALTPMPGLRQMAAFAAFGLIGAWLTVVLWLPRFTLHASPFTARLATGWWRLCQPRWRLSPWLALAGAVVLIVVCALRLTSDDSLALLNPSPAALMQDEARVQQLLDRDTGSRYFLVQAEDTQALLARLDVLDSALDKAIGEGLEIDYQSLAGSVPTAAEQQANLARVRKLYGAPLDELIQRAGLPAEVAEKARAQLEKSPMLTLANWLETPLGSLQQRLWLGETDDGGVAATAVVSGVRNADVDRTLHSLAKSQTHQGATVEYVDRVSRIGSLLGELRQHTAMWVALAMVLMTLALVARYRRRAWRVIVPPFGATLIVLTAFAVTGVPLNIFNQLGLLLVLGIGLDAGIFNVEHARRPSAWLAITLSTLTSLLAFGMLAFSATPALHYLGLTCLIGLASVWALVPWVRPADDAYPTHDSPNPSSREIEHGWG